MTHVYSPFLAGSNRVTEEILSEYSNFNIENEKKAPAIPPHTVEDTS